MYFRRPMLSRDTSIIEEDGKFSLSRPNCRLELKFRDPSAAGAARKLFHLLRTRTLELEQLYAASEGLTCEQVSTILAHLDDKHLLIEGGEDNTVCRTGRAVIVRLERAYLQWLSEERQGRLEENFFAGKLPREVLVGNAFEYYHLTSQAYGAILPALNRSYGRAQYQMLDFILDEYRHDRIMLKAITALGYSEQDVADSIPHSYTVGLMDLLAYWAATDDLAFKASLFIFEGKPKDSERYLEMLATYDLPHGYLESHAKHDSLNNDGGHGAVSRAFFADIEHVSEEEEARVLAKLRQLHRMMRDRSDAIYDYYSAPGAAIPRTVLAPLAPITPASATNKDGAMC